MGLINICIGYAKLAMLPSMLPSRVAKCYPGPFLDRVALLPWEKMVPAKCYRGTFFNRVAFEKECRFYTKIFLMDLLLEPYYLNAFGTQSRQGAQGLPLIPSLTAIAGVRN